MGIEERSHGQERRYGDDRKEFIFFKIQELYKGRQALMKPGTTSLYLDFLLAVTYAFKSGISVTELTTLLKLPSCVLRALFCLACFALVLLPLI